MGLQHLDILFDNKSFPDFQKCFCYVIIQFKMNDFIWYFRSNSTRRANILKQRSRSPDSDMLLISSAISRTMFMISFIGSFSSPTDFSSCFIFGSIYIHTNVEQTWKHIDHFCKGQCKKVVWMLEQRPFICLSTSLPTGVVLISFCAENTSSQTQFFCPYFLFYEEHHSLSIDP